MVEHGEVRVVHRGGSRINFRPPVVSKDSRFLLCASGEAVKVFSASTEELVHELRGHTDLVTGVLLKPSNHLQAYSCSADGTVRLWDFLDGVLIKTFVIGYPISSMCASAEHQGVVFVVTPTTGDKRAGADRFQLVAVHLPQTGDQLLDVSAVLDDVSADPAAVAFGRGGEYVASAQRLQLEVFFFKKQKSFRFFLKEDNKHGGRNTFCCVACHPTDDCIATGHEDGKIRLWRSFEQKRSYTYTTLHWHHGAVASLCFTPEGTNLLSGGGESVLVQWSYGQEQQRDFLPRLGAAITHISVSPDGALFCTAHSDNKITIIQSCVKVSAVIQGLVKGDAVRTNLVLDPRTGSLVLNGKPGHLQFYSVRRDQLLFNLDVVQQEFIHQAGLQQVQVVQAAFHGSGDWLATVEERKHKAELELALKLWAFDEPTQSFVLNTTISDPHEDQICSMSFSSSSTVLVSTSRDAHFKAWQLLDHIQDESPSWSCDFVGSFHRLVPQCCCFSADGSLLAVGFQEVVTVWSSASWELLTTLSQPPNAIRGLCFGRLSCSKYLLGTSSNELLCCWNLLTCSLEWSTAMDASLLLADPFSDNMAAFCSRDGSSDVFVFKPSEPRPLFSQKAVCPGKVSRAVFAAREEMLESCEESSQWLNRSQLFFLTQDMDLMTFTTKMEDERLMASSKQLTIDDSVAMTPFFLLLGKHRQQDDGAALSVTSADRTSLPQSSAAVKQLLQSPAHVLPSTSFLCSAFVKSLLVSVMDDRQENKHPEEEMESDKEGEIDSDGEMESSTTRPTGSGVSGGSGGAGGGRADSAAPPLTKAQMRELRRVKKLDHSWIANLLDSST